MIEADKPYLQGICNLMLMQGALTALQMLIMRQYFNGRTNVILKNPFTIKVFLLLIVYTILSTLTFYRG